MEECEVKFLDIDQEEIEKKLVEIGAKKVKEFHYRRIIFDYEDLRFDKAGSWVRLRDEGDKITLSYKERLGIETENGNDRGMYELEFNVSDFDKVQQFMLKLGLVEKFYMENKRIRYMFDDIEFDIDIWPMINPYLEIEAPDWDKVDKGIELLGFDKKEAKKFTATQVFERAGIRDKDYKIITFEKQVKKDGVE